MDLFTSPLAWGVVLLFTIIGVAGSVPTYYLGQKGMPAIREKYPQIPEMRLSLAHHPARRLKPWTSRRLTALRRSAASESLA